MIRSLLFAPGDSEKKMTKASEGDADVVILDLEDSVSESQKVSARGMVTEFLKLDQKRLNPGSTCVLTLWIPGIACLI